MKRKERLINIGIYICYAIIIMAFLFPLIWIISLSLKDLQNLFSVPPEIIPKDPAFSNFRKVFDQSNLGRYLFNSVKIVFFTVVGTLIISVPAAFNFSRLRFKLKKSMLFGVLIFQMMSPLIIAILLFRYFNALGIQDRHWSLILIYIAIEIPFQTWLLKSFFDSIPESIDEAAEIDGCTKLQTLTKVILPLSAPGLASAIIFAGIHGWSQFIIPFVLLDSPDLYPVAVGILNYQSTVETISTHFLAAASVISIIPAVILFITMQRFIIGALTAGAVKG